MRGSARPRCEIVLALAVALAAAVPCAAEIETVPGATYVGSKECQSCHEDETAAFAKTKMGHIFLHAPRDDREQLACENCHGPGSAHVKDEKKPGLILSFGKSSRFPVSVQNEACLQCHQAGEQTFWQGSRHEDKGLACVDCHTVMSQTKNASQLTVAEEKTPFYARRAETETCLRCHLDRAAQTMRSSHMPVREGKVTCTDCHNPHGSLATAMLRQNSVNENCYSCHAEKRGPFLWEHPPVLENCLNCHEPHGSIQPNLLKTRAPRLCQQCHISARHPTQPHGPAEAFTMNRACLNCHPQIHGSNDPSGVRFMR
jgi:DmsE family decaheme c-type cytochrome